jgi:hypothetical protein
VEDRGRLWQPQLIQGVGEFADGQRWALEGCQQPARDPDPTGSLWVVAQDQREPGVRVQDRQESPGDRGHQKVCQIEGNQVRDAAVERRRQRMLVSGVRQGQPSDAGDMAERPKTKRSAS